MLSRMLSPASVAKQEDDEETVYMADNYNKIRTLSNLELPASKLF